MKQRSKLFVPNIVLGIIFGVFALISAIVVIVLHLVFSQAQEDMLKQYMNEYSLGAGFSDSYSYGEGFYSILGLEDAAITKLGTEYKGYSPVEGSQYYLVSTTISNRGNDYELADSLGLYFYGQTDSDLEIMYQLSDNNSFYYYNTLVVPACNTTVVQNILRIRDGVEKIMVDLYNFDSEGEYSQNPADSLELSVPMD